MLPLKAILVFSLLGTSRAYFGVYNDLTITSGPGNGPAPAPDGGGGPSGYSLRNIYERAKSYVPRPSFFIPKMYYENGTLYYDWGLIHMTGTLRGTSGATTPSPGTTQPPGTPELSPTRNGETTDGPLGVPNIIVSPDATRFDGSLNPKHRATTPGSSSTDLKSTVSPGVSDVLPSTFQPPEETSFQKPSQEEPLQSQGLETSTAGDVLTTSTWTPPTNPISNSISRTGKKSTGPEESTTPYQSPSSEETPERIIVDQRSAFLNIDYPELSTPETEAEQETRSLDFVDGAASGKLVASFHPTADSGRPAEDKEPRSGTDDDDVRVDGDDDVRPKDGFLEKIVRNSNVINRDPSFWKAENYLGQKIGRPLFNYLMDNDMM